MKRTEKPETYYLAFIYRLVVLLVATGSETSYLPAYFRSIIK